MNNKDFKMELQPNNELKDDGFPKAIACTKPLVGSSAVGSVFLQVGMEVKIIDNKIDFPEDAGKVLKITKNLKDFDNKRAFELDNRKGDIFLIEDFEFCVNYPHLEMR